MKYKYLVCALIYVGLCSIDCYFSNVPMLNSIGQMGITEDVIFLNSHNSGSNFCGIKEILVVDTIPVLLGIYYALDKENPNNNKFHKRIQHKWIFLNCCTIKTIYRKNIINYLTNCRKYCRHYNNYPDLAIIIFFPRFISK